MYPANVLSLMSTNFLSLMENSQKWSVPKFLGNLCTALVEWGAIFVAVVGLIMVIVAVINIAKGLMSGGRSQTNWVVNLLLFFLGGALAFTSGWGLVRDIAMGGYHTLDELGTTGGTSIFMFFH